MTTTTQEILNGTNGSQPPQGMERIDRAFNGGIIEALALLDTTIESLDDDEQAGLALTLRCIRDRLAAGRSEIDKGLMAARRESRPSDALLLAAQEAIGPSEFAGRIREKYRALKRQEPENAAESAGESEDAAETHRESAIRVQKRIENCADLIQQHPCLQAVPEERLQEVYKAGVALENAIIATLPGAENVPTETASDDDDVSIRDECKAASTHLCDVLSVLEVLGNGDEHDAAHVSSVCRLLRREVNQAWTAVEQIESAARRMED